VLGWLVQMMDAPAATFQEALDWTWRYANIVHPGGPWIETGLRSAMVSDVFLVNGEAHTVMMMGFERFEFQHEGDVLILHGNKVPRLSCDRLFAHALERSGDRIAGTAP
jgi:hypothetical protein